MILPPYSVIASWPQPNYLNPETRGPAKEIITFFLLILVTIVLGIRIYTRRFISHGFGLDDTLICLSYIPATAFAISGIIADDRFGWNRHVWDVPPSMLTGSAQLGLASQIFTDVSITLTKLSMVALIYRLTSASDSRLRFAAAGLATLITLSGAVFVVVVVFQCRPVSAYWTLSLQPQKCINEAVHLLAAGVISFVTDLVVVLLPISIVWNLQLPLRQQIITVLLFAAGFLATAAGIARTVLTWQTANAHDWDITWRTWAVWVASSVELFVGILCASIPATKPFFSQYLPSILGSIPTRIQRSTKDSKAFISGTEVSEVRSPSQSFIRNPVVHNSTRQDSRAPTVLPPKLSPTVSGISISDLNKPLPPIFDPEVESSYESLDLSASSIVTDHWNPNLQSETPLPPPKR